MLKNSAHTVYCCLLALYLICISSFSSAQSGYAKNDTIFVSNLYKQGAKLIAAKPDSGVFYLRQAIAYTEKKSILSYYAAESYYLLGGGVYNKGKYQEALPVFENYRKLGEKLKNDQGLFMANNAIANVYTQIGKPDIALNYYLKCLAIANNTGNKKNLGMAYNNIAFVYKDEGKYDEAVNYLFKSIDVNESIDNKLAIGNNYLQLSVIFLRKGENITSTKYSTLALKIFEELHKADLVVISHYMLSAAYEALHDMAKARTELEFAVAIAKQMNDARAVALNSVRLGDLLTTDGKLTEALISYKEALVLMENMHLQRNIAYIYIAIGKIQCKTKNFTQSEINLKKGLEEARKNNQSETVSSAYQELSVLYHTIKKDSLAIEYLNLHNVQKDSLMNLQTSNKLAELQTKYETEKKQKQIEALNSQTALQASNLKNQGLELSKNRLEIDNQHLALDKNQLQLSNQQLELARRQSLLLQQQLESRSRGQKIKSLNDQNTIQQLEISKRNTTIMIIGIVFLIALLVGYQFYSRYKFKQEARLQAEVLNQQMLASKGIIEAEERERKRIAAELHDGVGQLFTTVKMNMEILMERFLVKQPDADLLAEKTMAMVDESCTEVRSIAHQMMPNALIKSGLVSALRDFINKIPAEKLKISLETKGIDKPMDSTTETVLYRVIQESVNNVIKHASATSLDILLLCDAKEITVSIEDNGKGFDAADKSKFSGIGLKNMISRVEYLKGSVDVSSSPGKGTLVAIFIPLT
jgi:signal transduction histidine kinase